METVACNLCGGTQAEIRYQAADYLMERPAIEATFVRCTHCGLIFQNPRPTPAEIGSHYPPDYDSFQEDARPASGWRSRLAWYGIEKRCRAVLAHRERGRLLDVGCATGRFILGMQQYPGWELYGVELNSRAAEIARQATSADIFTGTLDEAEFPDGSFDVVTLWDVLEHLHDPKAALLEANRVLKPGGIVALRVPNADSWDARLFGKYWFGLDAPRHLYVFGVHALQRLLKCADFEVLEANCKIGASVAPAFNLRFWMAGKGLSGRIPRFIQRAAAHPFSRLLTPPFTWYYDRKLEGSLVTMISAKRGEEHD
jgi:SAM-dependent methyltransferase